MHAKRLFLVAAVLALLLTTAVVYHQWSKKSAQVAFTQAIIPQAKSLGISQPKPSATSPVLMKPELHRSDRYAPIAGRVGHNMESNDLITALMDHEDLALTKDEMERMLTAYIEIGIERSHYEASIATVKVVSSTESVITIPTYSEEGAKLQAELYRKFTEALGVDRAAQVNAALATTLYFRSHGFGDAAQEIRVKLLDGEPITFVFAHNTDTLKVPYKNSYLTVKTTNADCTLSIGDLSSYMGLIDLLPKGGT